MNLYAFLIGSAALVIHQYSEQYRKDDLAVTLTELDQDDNLPRIKTYDFIIVGGGGAGCVVASRLSQHYSVLLLEAGGTPVPATRSQFFYDKVYPSPDINYLYSSVPQMNAFLQNGGVGKSTEGRMLGGSTSHNGLMYNRGHPLDYDHWATVLNDSSWEYKNLLKYFKRQENFIGRGFQGEHGHGGLLTVDTTQAPILQTWVQGGAELGYPEFVDPNGPQTEGFGPVQVTKEKGQRVSSYTAYIDPIEKTRRSLKIERYSYVSKILINKNKIAYGVMYKRHGIPQIAHATKEVIVSCGSFGSPILLMKSGIGPTKNLQEAGIPVIANLPVGETLNDHLLIFMDFSINNNLSLVPSSSTDLTEASLTNYHSQGTGILGYSAEWTQAFLVSSRAKKAGELEWPDVQLTLVGVTLVAPTEHTRHLRMAVVVGRPKSKGVFCLNSTAYKAGLRRNEELALIDYRYFSDSSDFDVQLEAVQLGVKLLEDTTAFKQLGTKFIGMTPPACAKLKFKSEEYWRCYIRQTGAPGDHASATCRMGFGPKDKHAVVDSEFKVLGIRNLRVVDASVIPVLPNANTAGPVYMIGEKASDDILKSHDYEGTDGGEKFAQVSQ